MKVLDRDLRSKRESLVKIIDQQRNEFAYNVRPIREASHKVETITNRIRHVMKAVYVISVAVSFFRKRAMLKHPTTATKKSRLVGFLLRQCFNVFTFLKRRKNKAVIKQTI
jgi:hypothetical protein